MPKYILRSTLQADLGTEGDFTTLTLEVEREQKPTHLSHFVGGSAAIWSGQSNHGETFDILSGEREEDVILHSHTNKGCWPLRARQGIQPGNELVLVRNGEHVFVIWKLEP